MRLEFLRTGANLLSARRAGGWAEVGRQTLCRRIQQGNLAEEAVIDFRNIMAKHAAEQSFVGIVRIVTCAAELELVPVLCRRESYQ